MTALTSMLQKGERVELYLRRLFESFGYKKYRMSKFENYDLYADVYKRQAPGFIDMYHSTFLVTKRIGLKNFKSYPPFFLSVLLLALLVCDRAGSLARGLAGGLALAAAALRRARLEIRFI